MISTPTLPALSLSERMWGQMALALPKAARNKLGIYSWGDLIDLDRPGTGRHYPYDDQPANFLVRMGIAFPEGHKPWLAAMENIWRPWDKEVSWPFEVGDVLAWTAVWKTHPEGQNYLSRLLTRAAAAGNTEACELLLEAGADVNYSGAAAGRAIERLMARDAMEDVSSCLRALTRQPDLRWEIDAKNLPDWNQHVLAAVENAGTTLPLDFLVGMASKMARRTADARPDTLDTLRWLLDEKRFGDNAEERGEVIKALFIRGAAHATDPHHQDYLLEMWTILKGNLAELPSPRMHASWGHVWASSATPEAYPETIIREVLQACHRGPRHDDKGRSIAQALEANLRNHCSAERKQENMAPIQGVRALLQEDALDQAIAGAGLEAERATAGNHGGDATETERSALESSDDPDILASAPSGAPSSASPPSSSRRRM